MSRFSQNQRDRERLDAVAKKREHEMRSWSDARNEGIREGLLMALVAVHDLPGDIPMLEAIKTRGDKHFGDSEWQAKPRRASP